MKKITSSQISAALAALKDARLLELDTVLDELSVIEFRSGVYGWWFDEHLPNVPREGCLERDGRRLLYIGTAPVNAKGMTRKRRPPLKSRLWRNHIKGGVRNSTLRYSVASLLDDEFRFRVKRDKRNKPSMEREEENRLSRWFLDHAQVSVFGCLEPWITEEEILRQGPPLPLNISKSSHLFRFELKQYRKALGSRR
ncbi:MAG TPA: hypothetical protein ENJ90_00190 [Devosia sp.]|nr:hypothetical protein [Devosia sp.]